MKKIIMITLITLSSCSVTPFRGFAGKTQICDNYKEEKNCREHYGYYDNFIHHTHDKREIEDLTVPVDY
jgi:hypothetical protein